MDLNLWTLNPATTVGQHSLVSIVSDVASSVVVNNNQTPQDKLLPDLLGDEAGENFKDEIKHAQANEKSNEPDKEKIILTMNDEFNSELIEINILK